MNLLELEEHYMKQAGLSFRNNDVANRDLYCTLAGLVNVIRSNATYTDSHKEELQ